MVDLENQSPSFKAYQLSLIIGLIGIIILLIGLRLVIFPIKEPEINFSNEASVSAHKAQEIKIDISGSVENPGVYTLDSNSRVQDLLVLAGGLSGEADREWVAKKINLASKLTDGGKIYIPSMNEAAVIAQNQSGQVADDLTSNYNISINNASKTDLESLPGIGEVTAQKIIDGRPYQSIEELITKKIVGQSVFEKIKEKVSAY